MTTNTRDELIAHQVVDEGRTLQSVGDEHGLTRERVRQIVTALRPGFSARTRQRTAAAARQAEGETRRQAERDQPRWRRGMRNPARHMVTPQKRYTDQDMLDGLRAFHDTHGRSPSVAAWVRHGHSPTPAVIMRRFGSWDAALETAGLPVNARFRTTYTYTWDYQSCVDAVAAFLAEPAGDLNPSAADYQQWSAGRDDVPSLATVRNRGRWAEIRDAAAARLKDQAA